MLSSRGLLSSLRVLSRPSSTSFHYPHPRSITQLPVNRYKWPLWKRLIFLGGTLSFGLPAFFLSYYGSLEAIEDKLSQLHQQEEDMTRTIPSFRQAWRAVTNAASEAWEVQTSDSASSTPIWTPPTRMTPDEELAWHKKHQAQFEEEFKNRKWIFYNYNAPRDVILLNDATVDKRLSDYLYSEDPYEFLPDLGAPVEVEEK